MTTSNNTSSSCWIEKITKSVNTKKKKKTERCNIEKEEKDKSKTFNSFALGEGGGEGNVDDFFLVSI